MRVEGSSLWEEPGSLPRPAFPPCGRSLPQAGRRGGQERNLIAAAIRPLCRHLSPLPPSVPSAAIRPPCRPPHAGSARGGVAAPESLPRADRWASAPRAGLEKRSPPEVDVIKKFTPSFFPRWPMSLHLAKNHNATGSIYPPAPPCPPALTDPLGSREFTVTLGTFGVPLLLGSCLRTQGWLWNVVCVGKRSPESQVAERPVNF